MMRLIKDRGFTVIELMLAMTFVSILLISVALLTIQISNTYTRGITMRQVNTAGRELANDLQRSVQASQQISDFVIFMDGGTDRVRRGEDAYNTAVNPSEADNIMGGRLCLQDRHYAWNTGAYLVQVDDSGGITDSPNVMNGNPVNLVQVRGISICGDDTDVAVGDFAPLDPTDSTETLSTGDRELAIHNFYVSGSSATGLYAISFTLGTNREGTLTDDSSRCRPPSDAASDNDYCTVNRFDIVARTIADRMGEE